MLWLPSCLHRRIAVTAMRETFINSGHALVRMVAIAVALSTFDRSFAEEELFPAFMAAEGEVRRLDPFAAEAYGIGYALDADGREIVVDTCGNTGVNAGASWTMSFDQKEPHPFAVSAQGFPERTDGDGDFQLYVDVTYADGSCLWGQRVDFSRVLSEGWHERTVVIQPSKPVRSAIIYAMLRRTASRVRFRDARVRMLEGDAANVFDSVAVVPRTMPDAPCFLVRDVAAKSGFAAIDGMAKGLRLDHSCEQQGEARFFDVTLAGQTCGDRAVTLVYAVPLPEGDLTWHAHPRASQPLEGARTEVRNTLTSPCGAGGLSHWPFGAVSVGDVGIAIGLDPSAPAYFRTAVNPVLRILYISFDVGLTEEKPSAHMRFCVFPFDAAEKFRGAFEAYMHLFPDAFAVRQKRHGIWMAFNKISMVQGWEDFGFAIKEGDNETDWDDVHGMTTFHYTEPGTWWMRIAAEDGKTSLSMDECIDKAMRLASDGDSMALAWRTSVCRDERGRPMGIQLDTPWCNGMVWSMNSAPGIAGDFTDFDGKIGDAELAKRYSSDAVPPQGLDGEYVDSADMYVTAALDFDRAHFGTMKTPLCFSRDTCAPGIFKGMVSYEYVRSLADRLHPRGRLVMGNSTPIRWCWLAPYLDVMGCEIDWNLNSGWQPASDEQMLFHRALCGGKPFCYLMNTDLSTFTNEKVEKFMMRSVAYGLFPGIFSKTTSGRHYFDWPELYNRDRALFKKYIPVCRAISEAGWRPVNRVLETDDDRILIEQFGPEEGTCYVTLFNDSDMRRTFRMRLKEGRSAPLGELVAGELPVWNGGVAEMTLPPETLRVLAFAPKQ